MQAFIVATPKSIWAIRSLVYKLEGGTTNEVYGLVMDARDALGDKYNVKLVHTDAARPSTKHKSVWPVGTVRMVTLERKS